MPTNRTMFENNFHGTKTILKAQFAVDVLKFSLHDIEK